MIFVYYKNVSGFYRNKLLFALQTLHDPAHSFYSLNQIMHYEMEIYSFQDCR